MGRPPPTVEMLSLVLLTAIALSTLATADVILDNALADGECTCRQLIFDPTYPNGTFKAYQRTVYTTLVSCQNEEIRCLYRIDGQEGKYTRLALNVVDLEPRDELNIYHVVNRSSPAGTLYEALVPYML